MTECMVVTRRAAIDSTCDMSSKYENRQLENDEIDLDVMSSD